MISGEFARTFEDALILQSEQCRAIAACRARFPTDVRTQLRTVMDRLKTESPEVEYRDLRTNVIKRDRVTADAVIGLAFTFSYAPQSAALLPLVLDEAAAGRYAPLMALSHMDMQINQPMQWSVVCAEDADRYRPAPAHQALLLGEDVPRSVFAACPVWPSGKRAADFTAPLRSQVPALLLSGQLDPVTPPRYGDTVAQGTAQWAASGCTRPGTQRHGAGLHPQADGAVHRNRQCRCAGCALRCRPQQRARVHLVQRMGTMSRTDQATEALA